MNDNQVDNIERLIRYIGTKEVRNGNLGIAGKVSREFYDALVSCGEVKPDERIKLESLLPIDYEDVIPFLEKVPSLRDNITIGLINDCYNSSIGDAAYTCYLFVKNKKP